jgi:hypothetical protein
VQGRNPTIQVLIMDLLQQQLLTMVHMISATTLEEEEEEKEEDQGLIQLDLDLVQQTCSNHQTKSLISSNTRNSRHTMGLLKVGQGQRLDNNNSMGGLISLQEELMETKPGRSSWAMVQAEEEEEEEEEEEGLIKVLIEEVAAAAMALSWVVLNITMQQQQLIPTVELQIKEQDIMERNKALKLDMELP